MTAADALVGLGGLGASAWLFTALFAGLVLVVCGPREPATEPGRRALR